jgi:hypothetical protein
MTPNATWHADAELLAGYVAGALGRAPAASVEAHLMTCALCRAAVSPLADPDRLARNLAAITERVDEPRLLPIERLLQRLGVPERVTRVLMITPAARAAWLAGVAVALAIAVVADLNNASEGALFAFLVVAPLLPLAAVAAAFGSRTDPVRELIVAAPVPAFELLLLRSLAVLAPTIAVAAVASLVIPHQPWDSALWLLPSFGLAATTLALGTWFPVRPVACALGGAWIAAAAISVRGAPRAELVERFAAFRPAGQLALLVVTLAAGAVVVRRRDSFDLVDVGRTS